ncbi:hypothetical protein HPB49_020807 [Dermacentor silvarum]|uniref:Uncharacterized protein n=1 Tax=Dermacentor silvarum TaxID=543639 RepID=A0ACB8D7Z6_DERSI|nr:hypothetical protein HPB49_020807 [Dermacentor silvarum]
MVLLVITIVTILGATFLGFYNQYWSFSALGIGQRRGEDDFYGAPPLLVHKRDSPQAQTQPPPVLDRVREATGRIDVQRYESVAQALQVVRYASENVPVESLIILLPLLLGVLFKCCCRRKLSRPSSSNSQAARCSSSTLHSLFGDRPLGSTERDDRMQRSYGMNRGHFPKELPPVEFPAISSYVEGCSALNESSHGESLRSRRSTWKELMMATEEWPFSASHKSITNHELTAAGEIKQWLPGITCPNLQGHRPTTHERVPMRLSDADFRGFGAGQEELGSREGPYNLSASDKIIAKRDDGSDARSSFVEELFCRTVSVTADDTEKIQADYDAEDQPLLQLSDNSSDYHGSNDETRHSVGGDGDRSEVNNSGLSEETAYMKLPRSERSSEAMSICSIEDATQDAWFSVAATVDPLVATRVALRSSPQWPRNAFGHLLEACRQPEPVAFSTILQELGVENCVKLHESEHADIFLVSMVRGGTMALKVYDCEHMAKYLRSLINEIQVSWSLTMLAEGLENQTKGFPHFHLAHCVWDSYPALLESACSSYLKRRGSADFREFGRKLYSPYVVLCMDNAGEPLSKMTRRQFDNALQLRSVVQQVALAVAVAEAELEFEHRALTPGHVLLKPARGRVAHYRFMNNAVSVELHGWEACIVDFAASRLCLGGGEMPVYVGLHELPDGKRNAVGDRLVLIDRTVRPDASLFHPYTNVIFLHDLVRGLLHTHEPMFANYAMSSWTDAERKAWGDLTLWSEEISDCSSARDFVIARVLLSTEFGTSPTKAEEV